MLSGGGGGVSQNPKKTAGGSPRLRPLVYWDRQVADFIKCYKVDEIKEYETNVARGTREKDDKSVQNFVWTLQGCRGGVSVMNETYGK